MCWICICTTINREAVATYLVEIRKLSLRILKLISEGLGLEVGYFDESSEVQLLSVNNYPPCPDPSLTLGILKHQDPSLITILYQGDVSGLQVCKDGQWIGVGAERNAFVVNVGNQLEVRNNFDFVISFKLINSRSENYLIVSH